MLLFLKICLLIHLNTVYFYMLVIERLIFLHCVDVDLRRSRPAVRNVMLGNADTTPPQGMRIRMCFEVVSSVFTALSHTSSAKRSIAQHFTTTPVHTILGKEIAGWGIWNWDGTFVFERENSLLKGPLSKLENILDRSRPWVNFWHCEGGECWGGKIIAPYSEGTTFALHLWALFWINLLAPL